MTFIFLLLIVIILLFGISLAKENLEQIEQINASIRQQLEYEKEICRHLNNKS
jgi:hypothetical protein